MVFTGGVRQAGGGEKKTEEGEKKKTEGGGEKKTGGGGEKKTGGGVLEKILGGKKKTGRRRSHMLLEVQSCLVMH